MNHSNHNLAAMYRESLDQNSPINNKGGSLSVFENLATLSVADVAYCLKVSSRTVERMLQKKEILGRKAGRKWVIPRQAFLEWLHSREESHEQI